MHNTLAIDPSYYRSTAWLLERRPKESELRLLFSGIRSIWVTERMQWDSHECSARPNMRNKLVESINAHCLRYIFIRDDTLGTARIIGNELCNELNLGHVHIFYVEEARNTRLLISE